MKYRYAYKSSDGIRHESEIEADSRDAAFEALRRDGIRPIKVVATDGSKENGEVRVLGIPRRVFFVAVAATAAVAAATTWWMASARQDATPPAAMPPATTGTFATLQQDVALRRIAMPLPRQEIHGNRRRLEIAPTNLFATTIETYLSKFAEPGREVASSTRPSIPVDDLLSALDAPIHFTSDEYSEYIDLKRITAGIKREMADFLRGGDTPDEYYAALENRQRLEASQRAKAEWRLREMVSKNAEPSKAYDYWLKANAQLQSMGIYPIPLPDALRDYQFNLNLDE